MKQIGLLNEMIKLVRDNDGDLDMVKLKNLLLQDQQLFELLVDYNWKQKGQNS